MRKLTSSKGGAVAIEMKPTKQVLLINGLEAGTVEQNNEGLYRVCLRLNDDSVMGHLVAYAESLTVDDAIIIAAARLKKSLAVIAEQGAQLLATINSTRE